MPQPAAPTTRSAAPGRISRFAFTDLAAAQKRERDLTRARDRLQGLADVLAKREAAGEGAGFDRLRSEREVLDLEADRAAASSERARAQAMLAGVLCRPCRSDDACRRGPSTRASD